MSTDGRRKRNSQIIALGGFMGYQYWKQKAIQSVMPDKGLQTSEWGSTRNLRHLGRSAWPVIFATTAFVTAGALVKQAIGGRKALRDKIKEEA